MHGHCPGKRAKFGHEKGRCSRTLAPPHRNKKDLEQVAPRLCVIPRISPILRQPSASTRSRATALPQNGPKQKVEIGEVGFMLLIHHLCHFISVILGETSRVSSSSIMILALA
jgi:hypothetical protein